MNFELCKTLLTAAFWFTFKMSVQEGATKSNELCFFNNNVFSLYFYSFILPKNRNYGHIFPSGKKITGLYELKLKHLKFEHEQSHFYIQQQ